MTAVPVPSPLLLPTRRPLPRWVGPLRPGPRAVVAPSARLDVPRGRSRYDGRALHWVDIENLAGNPAADADRITRIWAAYRGGVPISKSDHVVVASCSQFAKTAWFVLPATGIQRRVRDGADGAELALLDEFDVEATARRFDRLVIASGDGRFTEAALTARAAGLHVHHVVGLSQPARRLTAAVTTHSRLRLQDDRPGRLAARRPTLRSI